MILQHTGIRGLVCCRIFFGLIPGITEEYDSLAGFEIKKGKNKAGINFEIILSEKQDKTKPDGNGCITFGMFCYISANFCRTTAG
jgi:hypothetical protein